MNNLKEEKKSEEDDNCRHRAGKNSYDCKTKSQINEEYFKSLEKWLEEVYSYSFPGFSYGYLPPSLTFLNNIFQTRCSNNLPPTVTTFPSSPIVQPNHQQPTIESEVGQIFTIPPLWKRFLAEMVDFLLLLIMKVVITFIAVDYFDFLDFSKYEALSESETFDFKLFIEVTSEVTFLEFSHRVVVCLYEGIFLHKGVHNLEGGATPGKSFMGLKVVLCKKIENVENNPYLVKVIPAKNLGFRWSFVRAFLKNLVIALLIPFFVPFFFNKHNRSGYDVLCNSVVVENTAPPNRNR